MSRQAKQSPTSAWSYKAGEKGRNRVRVFDWPGHGLWIDYKEDGKRHRRPLDHDDRARAKQLADTVAAQLGALEPAAAAVTPATITWAQLSDMYEGEVTPTKAPGTQAHDRRVFRMTRTSWGGSTLVDALDRRLWDRFIRERRQGLYGRGKARDGVIGNDLQTVIAVMNWAKTVKVAGRPLLIVNPFDGFPIPLEENPSQPTLTEEEVVKCFRAAAKVNSQVPLFLALAYETGKRYMAIARLRWSDVDLKAGTITWRAQFDKTRTRHVAPISVECTRALQSARRKARAIGDAWLFVDSEHPDQPVGAPEASRWWRKLETAAGIVRIRQRGWHSCRRTLATDLSAEGASLKTIMEIVGWKTQKQALQYIHPTEKDQRVALRSRRRAHGT